MKKNVLLLMMFSALVCLSIETKAQTKTVAPKNGGVLKVYGKFNMGFLKEVLTSSVVSDADRATFESNANITLDEYRITMARFWYTIVKKGDPFVIKTDADAVAVLVNAVTRSRTKNHKELASGTMVYTYGTTNGSIDSQHPTTRFPYGKDYGLDEDFLEDIETGIHWLSSACGNACDFKDKKPTVFAKRKDYGEAEQQTRKDVVTYDPNSGGSSNNTNTTAPNTQPINVYIDNIIPETQANANVSKNTSQCSNNNQNRSGEYVETLEDINRAGAIELAKAKWGKKIARASGTNDGNGGFGKQVLAAGAGALAAIWVTTVVNRATYGRGVGSIGAAQYTAGVSPTYASFGQGFLNPYQGGYGGGNTYISDNDSYYYKVINGLSRFQRRETVSPFGDGNWNSNSGYYPNTGRDVWDNTWGVAQNTNSGGNTWGGMISDVPMNGGNFTSYSGRVNNLGFLQ